MSTLRSCRRSPNPQELSGSEGFSSSEDVPHSQNTSKVTGPLRSILKKASKVLKSDLAAAKYMGEVKKPAEVGLPSFSLSGIHEESIRTSGSGENEIQELAQKTNTFVKTKTVKTKGKFSAKGKPPISPPRRPSPKLPLTSEVSVSPPTDFSLIQQVGAIIQTIKTERGFVLAQRQANRQKRLAQVLTMLLGDKDAGKPSDHSLVNVESEDGGSETEHGSFTNNRLAMKLAVRQYASDPGQREELLRLIDASGTPRLSILMRKNRVEGLYRQGPSGFLKVYGSEEAPELVQPGMIRKCFEFKAESLAPVPPKQLWKADAFAL